jgi:hypothetical protein
VRRYLIHAIEFVTSEGIRLEWDGEVWRVQNSRQLGEAAKKAAFELIAKAEEIGQTVPAELIGKHPLADRADFVAKRLKLRITHKRKKHFES